MGKDILSSIYVLPAFSIFCFGAATGVGVCILSEILSKVYRREKGKHEHKNDIHDPRP